MRNSPNIRLEEWRVVEEGFQPALNRVAESLFSLGNGHMGVRGNFEEHYSGDTLTGSYLGGIYYPEKTIPAPGSVGLPVYRMKMPNAANWIGIHVEFDGEPLDLAHCEISEFRRVLDMRQGTLERSFRATLASGKEVEVRALRFCSMAEPELGAIRYSVRPLNFSGTLTFTPFVDINVSNEETLTGERFWVEVETQVKRSHAYLLAETKKTEFQVCTGMKIAVFQGEQEVQVSSLRIHREKMVACGIDLPCLEGRATVLIKYAANLSSLNHPKEGLLERCKRTVKQAARKGFELLLEEHRQVWAEIWSKADVVIEGDISLQQGIRFSIFHLCQAYQGRDERLSVSPKGFTGERYGGCTYWSAEIFCLPFFLGSLGPEMARPLLKYRFRHLSKAIENASRLGLGEGAALFPMVTMDGQECATDWAIALEEIHRNGAVAYAIYNYVRSSGDEEYLLEYGLEVLTAIARFWAQRVHYSEQKRQFVLHGVTGPNEYENNVNNNWYTNYLAAWCLRYAADAWQSCRRQDPRRCEAIAGRIQFSEYPEINRWREVADRLYLPDDPAQGIFLQQDDYLEKELPTLWALSPEERPLHRFWSRDRILRSAYIQRADVLQGLFLFEDQFELEAIRRNFEFYEARTVHESSLSYPVHAVLAARLGEVEKAGAYFRQSVRFDLHNAHGDTDAGCHVTSMGGAWLALVRGLAGLRPDSSGRLHFDPQLPGAWKSYAFSYVHQGTRLGLEITGTHLYLQHLEGPAIRVFCQGEEILLPDGERLKIERRKAAGV